MLSFDDEACDEDEEVKGRFWNVALSARGEAEGAAMSSCAGFHCSGKDYIRLRSAGDAQIGHVRR